MWAIRRTIHLRNHRLISGHAQICCGKLEITKCSKDYSVKSVEAQEQIIDGSVYYMRFYNTSSSHLTACREVRTFSSQAGAKSGGEESDDLEDGFSELETPRGIARVAASGDENENDLSSGSESDKEGVADDIHNELNVLGENKSPKSVAASALVKVILPAPASSLSKVLDNWVAEGHEVTHSEVSSTVLHLRRRRMFYKALQLLELVESAKHLKFCGSDYISRIDLIAKVRGVYKAEEYLNQIPESFRGEMAYNTLLANSVSVTNLKKSEELFNKMKKLGFATSCFTCNQMLLLYKRTDKKKIAVILQLMEEENIKPSLLTYQILIDAKGQSKDVSGMDQIVKAMKAEGREPNAQIQASLVRYYIASSLEDKAEAVLKEMEVKHANQKHTVNRLLLPIYASLGRENEVDRIWKACEPDARVEDYMAAIEAWGRLNKIENAEATFNEMLKNVKKPSSRHFTGLLKVYANHKMLAKGKDLVKRMEDSGCTIGPLIWDSLVKLYVGAGEVEKADSLLEKADKQKRGRPLFTSYLTVMDKYVERGDIHNTEKVFLVMKKAGYAPRHRTYQALLQAYINAKAPAYGFRDRMKADGIAPNKSLAGQLGRVDTFQNSAVDDLLE